MNADAKNDVLHKLGILRMLLVKNTDDAFHYNRIV